MKKNVMLTVVFLAAWSAILVAVTLPQMPGMPAMQAPMSVAAPDELVSFEEEEIAEFPDEVIRVEVSSVYCSVVTACVEMVQLRRTLGGEEQQQADVRPAGYRRPLSRHVGRNTPPKDVPPSWLELEKPAELPAPPLPNE